MKSLFFLIGREVSQRVESELDTLKQTLKKEKKDFAPDHIPLQTIKREKNDFVRRFDMYLIYSDMNKRFGKSKGT